MRRSRATLSLLAAAVLVLGACARLAPALGATGQAGATRQARAAAAAASLPAHYAAPYLQITSDDAGDMAADLSASGDKYYTLALLIPQSGCTPEWEDNGDPVGAFTSQVNSLQAAGGGVIISFGGESGGELAQTCTSVSSLTAAYANVVNTYGADRLDFDIEGATLSDTAANNRRNQALAALQAEDPAVQVDYTLAVAPSGLPSAELGVLQSAQTYGVKVSVVNIMTMDFGNGQNALSDAESAAQATASQLASLYGISTSQADARMVCADVRGASTANFTPVQVYTCNGTNAQQWTVASGNTLQVLGKCLDVNAAGTSNGTTVDLYDCNGTGAQVWVPQGNGALLNPESGKCLDDTGWSTTPGTQLQIWSCTGGANQSWTLPG